MGNELKTHYGPTPEDSDPGKRWHYYCGGEVWWLKSGGPDSSGADICLKCGAQSDIPYDDVEGAVMHLEDVRVKLADPQHHDVFTGDQIRALVWIIDHSIGLGIADDPEGLRGYLEVRAPFLEAKRAQNAARAARG